MKKITRQQFLGIGAGLTAGAVGCVSPETTRSGLRPSMADLVVINGNVYTMNPAQPEATAFAVKQNRFVAVGSDNEIRSFKGSGTQVIDARGMTVTPGFIDAHSHPSSCGVDELLYVDTNLPNIDAIKQALRERAAQTPPGEWVVGFKYDDTKLEEGRPLTRKDLDEAVPDHPAVVGHRGGHTSVYNSRAFQLAGVGAATPSPSGGKFYVKDGELTGLVAETADAFMRRLLPSTGTRELRRQGVKLISQKMAESGLTSVHDAGVFPDDVIAYQDAYHAGDLSFRVYLMVDGSGASYEGLLSAGIYTGFGDEWLRVGAVKYYADGSASERTMRMSTPFVGRPNDYGILTSSQEEIFEVVERAHRNNFQVGIHANGDVAIDMVLKAYERVQQRWPRPDPRHRIEHCTLVNPDLLKRIKATGTIPTPFYTYVYYHGDKWDHYGDEKLRWMFAHRSFLDHGIPVASASDYVPGPYEPMMAIQSMVTRTDFRGKVWGPNQRITVDQALQVCTVNAAHASFEENLKGSITEGKLADFVVLGEDPHTAEVASIKDIPVIRTVVGGRTVHAREEI